MPRSRIVSKQRKLEMPVIAREEDCSRLLLDEEKRLLDMSPEELEEYFDNLIRLVLHEGTAH